MSCDAIRTGATVASAACSRPHTVVLACLTALLLGIAQPASNPRESSGGKLDAAMRLAAGTPPATRHRVILRTRPNGMAALASEILRTGGRITAELSFIESIAAEVDTRTLARLASASVVEGISSDTVVKSAQDSDNEESEGDGTQVTGSDLTQVLRATLGLPEIPTWTGRGIGIALIDSGLEPSADFDERIKAVYDFTNAGRPMSPADDYGHGTHVAGLIGGDGELAAQFRGIAPGAAFTVLKVLDNNGVGRTSDVIAAIEFATTNRAALGVDIVNLSLGHPIYEPAATDPLVRAVERAVLAGLHVVVSAGNHGRSSETGEPGYAGILSPANAPSAITVGAFATNGTIARGDDRMAAFSSRGPAWYDGLAKPDVVAPGAVLISNAALRGRLYNDHPSLRLQVEGSTFLKLSGTSMAAAVVSGVAACMLEASRSVNGYPAQPSLSPNALKAILQYTALTLRDDSGAAYDGMSQGAGGINAAGAIALAAALDTSQLEGAPWTMTHLLPATASTTIAGESIPWAQAIVWGNTAIWGDTVQVNQPAWAVGVPWGQALVWGNTVSWGEDIVWRDPWLWGNAIVWGNHAIGLTDGSALVWGNVGATSLTTAWQDLEDVVKKLPNAATTGPSVMLSQ